MIARLKLFLIVAAAGVLIIVVERTIRASVHRAVWGNRDELEHLLQSSAFSRLREKQREVCGSTETMQVTVLSGWSAS